MNRLCRRFSISPLAIAGFIAAVAAVGLPASPKATAAEPERLRRWTKLSWEHWDYPLFSVYGPFAQKPDASVVLKQIGTKKSALDVFNFREVILADDNKGITLWLHEQDTRLLKKLAEKNPGQWLVAVAPPKDFFVGPPSVAVVAITPTIAGGHIVFKHPECGAVAQNLRRRFRIAEFRLTP